MHRSWPATPLTAAALFRMAWNPSYRAPRAADLQTDAPLPEPPRLSETEQHLLDGVLADPDADFPRAAYAGWRDRQGCSHHAPDFSPFGGSDFAVRRGFVEGMSLTGRAFISFGERLMRMTPLREVRLVAVQPFLGELARCPHLAKLRRLDLTGNRIGSDGVEALAASPFLSGLRELGLNGNHIGPAGFDALLAAPWLGNLTTLELADNGIGAAELARLPALHALDFSDNVLESVSELPAGLEQLKLARCRLKQFPDVGHGSLRELDLSNNSLGTDGATALAENDSLSQLRSLDVSFNDIKAPGVSALCGMDAPLESLKLRGNRITEAGAQAIANADGFGSVIHLDLGTNPIGDAGAVALMRGEALATLERLSFANCGITDDGVKALTSTGALGGLRELSLAWNVFGDAGVKALAACPDLAGLRHLDLTGTHIGFAGAIALAESPHFTRLQSVTLGENERLPADGVALLRERYNSPHA
jgi:Leucine-rich repeat (LRR) protein